MTHILIIYSIYTYKRVVCVCLLVCWFVCFLSATRHLSTLRRCLRVAERAGAVVAGGPARARGQAHAQREHARAHAVQLLNVKIAALIYDAFQKQSRTRAHAVVYVTGEIFKKKTNMPLPKFSLQFAFSWSVYFSNRTESYSSQIEFAGPMESRRTRRPTFTAEERLERRREQDRRRHAERRARQRREQTQARRDVECLRCSQALA